MKKVTLVLFVALFAIVSNAFSQELTAPMKNHLMKLFPGENPETIWSNSFSEKLGKDRAKMTYKTVTYRDSDTTYDSIAHVVYKNGRRSDFVPFEKNTRVFSYNGIAFGLVLTDPTTTVCLSATRVSVDDYDAIVKENIKREAREQKLQLQQQIAQQQYVASQQLYAQQQAHNAYVQSGGVAAIQYDQQNNGYAIAQPQNGFNRLVKKFVDYTSSNSSNGIYDTGIWTANSALGTSRYRECAW